MLPRPASLTTSKPHQPLSSRNQPPRPSPDGYKEGETTTDIFAFLTTEPNKVVGAIHAKAMPVILTTRKEIDTWMTAPPEALKR
jgi:putative SOS response-associated peptidase YedK